MNEIEKVRRVEAVNAPPFLSQSLFLVSCKF